MVKYIELKNYVLAVIILAICFALTACSNHSGNKHGASKIIADSAAISNLQANAETTDSLAEQKSALTKMYTQAIATFLNSAYIKDKTTFDTLYFGKHVYGQADDFPAIELPNTIENTQIRLISPAVGHQKQAARKSLIYVNMVGWVDQKKAAFIFVVFSNGGEHQYDYFIDYAFNTSTNKFELDKIAFENYLHLNGKKPQRTTIYKEGNYVGSK